MLRPGGRLRIVDDGAGRYAAVLRDVGCTGVAVHFLFSSWLLVAAIVAWIKFRPRCSQ